MSNEMWVPNDVLKLASDYETYCIRIAGGFWKFDRHGIRFKQDDGSEVTVATVPTVDGEDDDNVD